MFRLWFMTFFGESRRRARRTRTITEPPSTRAPTPAVWSLEADEHARARRPRDPRGSCSSRSSILAILSVIGGWVGMSRSPRRPQRVRALPRSRLQRQPASRQRSGSCHAWNCALACISRSSSALIGFFLAYIFYCKKPGSAAHSPHSSAASIASLINKYWVDEIYGAVIVTPLLCSSALHPRRPHRPRRRQRRRPRRRRNRAGLRRARRAHSVRQHSLLRRLARRSAPPSLLVMLSYFGCTTHFCCNEPT